MRDKAELQRGQILRVFAPVQRVDEGARMVHGVFVSDAPVDEYGTGVVLDWEATRVAVEAWRAWGNIREMHQLVAAGVAREITLDDEAHLGRVGAYIVDDPAWEKVKAGVYKGFSIGADPLRWEVGANYGDPVRVTEYEIVEVSLVDKPKDATNVIEMWRAAGGAPGDGREIEAAVWRVLTRIMQAQTGGAKVSVLEQVWTLAVGEGVEAPESPEEALEILRAAIAATLPASEAAPTPEAAPLSEVQRVADAQTQSSLALDAQGVEIAALREEMGGLAQALSTALERVTQLEQTPVVPAVSRAVQADAPDAQARIVELERVIRAKRLSPDTPEVLELARLYQQRRSQA